MRLLVVFFLFLCVVTVRGSLDVASVHQQLMARLHLMLSSHALLMASGNSSFDQCFNAMPAPPTAPGQSSASAACVAAVLPASVVLAQATLATSMTPVQTGDCTNAAQQAKWNAQQPATCTTTYPYPAAALAMFKINVTNGNARMLAEDFTLQSYIKMSMSMSGQSQTMYRDETENTLGAMLAMPNVCTDDDLRRILNQVNVIMQTYNGLVSTLTQCLSAAAAAGGISLSISLRFGLGVAFYTAFDANNQPVQSSKMSAQGSIGGASALTAPAHVWLLTAVAAAALLVAGARH